MLRDRMEWLPLKLEGLTKTSRKGGRVGGREEGGVESQKKLGWILGACEG